MSALVQVLTDLVLENKNKVVLNFRQVKHVSLNAISMLVERNLRFRALGGELKLVGLIPYVGNLFKLVGAFSQFDVVGDEEHGALGAQVEWALDVRVAQEPDEELVGDLNVCVAQQADGPPPGPAQSYGRR